MKPNYRREQIKPKNKLKQVLKSPFIPALLCGCLAILAAHLPLWAETHALLVGVGNYRYHLANGIQPLDGPIHDVALMARLLETEYKPVKITRLTNGTATSKNIRNALNNLVSETKPGDTVLFYFSGHGVRLADGNGDEKDGCDEALVAYDFRRRGPTSDGLVTDDQLGVLLAALANRRVVALFDCCFSGTSARGVKPDYYRSRYIPPRELETFDQVSFSRAYSRLLEAVKTTTPFSALISSLTSALISGPPRREPMIFPE